jgi:hypothetical protein
LSKSCQKLTFKSEEEYEDCHFIDLLIYWFIDLLIYWFICHQHGQNCKGGKNCKTCKTAELKSSNLDNFEGSH